MDGPSELKHSIATWKQAAPELEVIRRREIEELNTQKVLALLEDAFNQALRDQPPRTTSGLVEMQRLFAKIPR